MRFLHMSSFVCSLSSVASLTHEPQSKTVIKIKTRACFFSFISSLCDGSATDATHKPHTATTQQTLDPSSAVGIKPMPQMPMIICRPSVSHGMYSLENYTVGPNLEKQSRSADAHQLRVKVTDRHIYQHI